MYINSLGNHIYFWINNGLANTKITKNFKIQSNKKNLEDFYLLEANWRKGEQDAGFTYILEEFLPNEERLAVLPTGEKIDWFEWTHRDVKDNNILTLFLQQPNQDPEEIGVTSNPYVNSCQIIPLTKDEMDQLSSYIVVRSDAPNCVNELYQNNGFYWDVWYLSNAYYTDGNNIIKESLKYYNYIPKFNGFLLTCENFYTNQYYKLVEGIINGEIRSMTEEELKETKKQVNKNNDIVINEGKKHNINITTFEDYFKKLQLKAEMQIPNENSLEC